MRAPQNIFQIRSGRIQKGAAGAPGPRKAPGLAGAALHRARLTVVPRNQDLATSNLPFVTLVGRSCCWPAWSGC